MSQSQRSRFSTIGVASGILAALAAVSVGFLLGRLIGDAVSLGVTGTVVAGFVGLTVVLYVWYRLRRSTADGTEARIAAEEGSGAVRELVAGVSGAVFNAEAVGRKLAAQVGETLSSTARIASRTVDARGRVQSLSDQISDGASAMEEILAAIESLSRQIDEQGNVVDQSAAAIEEMSASIESVASVAEIRKSAADTLRSLTDTGNQAVRTTDHAITEVGESVAAVNAMIETINDIAARTN
ncbi:MAG: hypothetical protein PF508_04835, partial [Spirochaeta sp.]|nr:hypothetical protein [Spirochaeta sp.]